MATLAAARRIALALPGTSSREEEGDDRFGVAVENKGKAKGYAWVWMERVAPKKPRVANPGVIAIRVAGEDVKEMMLASEPAKFFTEPHYQGFPAILVRLKEVKEAELRALLTDGWRCMAPKAVVQAYDKRRRGR